MLSYLRVAALCVLFVKLQATQPLCKLDATDLAFVIDGSTNVGATNFQATLDAIKHVTELAHIGPTQKDSRIALVVFDTEAHIEFGLMNTSNADVVAAIQRVRYPGISGTNIALGMDAATRQIYNRAHPQNRMAPKKIIIITSSNDNSDVRAERSLAEEVGATPIAIGVGNGANRENLAIATGVPNNVHMIESYLFLESKLEEILCLLGPTVPPPTTNTTVPAKTARACDCDYRRVWMDLIFVFDSSLAVNKYDFYAVRNFVGSFVKKIQVSQQQGAYSRIGLINVADTAQVIADLHTYTDSMSAYTAIRNLKYMGKPSMNLKEGLVAAQNMIANANDRPAVRKVVVVFTTKDELCAYQQKTHQKEKTNLAAIDENPCTIAARIVESGNILLTVGMKFDGAQRFPQLNLGSPCYKMNFDENFSSEFLKKMCKANCYCLPPYVQYSREDQCVEYGECLYVQQGALSHDIAQETCFDYKATLVEAFSADKEAFITEIQAPHLLSGTWLALQSVNGVYQWNGINMTPADYTNWAPNEPQSVNGNCVVFAPKQGWISRQCEDIIDTSNFVCQRNSCDTLHYCDFATFAVRKTKNKA